MHPWGTGPKLGEGGRFPSSYINHINKTKLSKSRYLLVQLKPSPEYPVPQVHSNDPAVFVHCAKSSQFDVPAVHSSISVHVYQSTQVKEES